MDRYTERQSDFHTVTHKPIQFTLARLADYEDIGTVEQFREWAEDEKDGRHNRNTGEWAEGVGYDDSYNPVVVCSVCEREKQDGESRYCPHCGASMWGN